MSGHNKWSQIKHQKGVVDKKRSKVFSKLLKAITIAARSDANPQFNPQLRSAIAKAKEGQVPTDTIERAVTRASESENSTEELFFEAYGPGGIALLMHIITDNRNRSVAEIKKILGDFKGKWAEIGSVRWAFEPGSEHGEWIAKFPQSISQDEKSDLDLLLEALNDHDDIQKVVTNAAA